MSAKKNLLFIIACTIMLCLAMNPQRASADKNVVIEPNKEYSVTMAGEDDISFFIKANADCRGTIYIYDIKTTYTKHSWSEGEDTTKTYKDTTYNSLLIICEDFEVNVHSEEKASCSFSGDVSGYKNNDNCTDFSISNALPIPDWDDYGVYTLLYTTFKVKVVTKPYPIPGSAVKIEEGIVDNKSCKLTLVLGESDFATSKVRIYRKSSAHGKYKLLKTKKYSWDPDEEMEFTDKKVKRNKCYWYSVSTYDKDTKQWSKKSKAIKIWTVAPKVKIKRNGNVITWKKTKGAKGYVVQEEWKEMVGYNIFGNRLTDYYVKSYFSKKPTYRLKNSGRGKVSVTVYPYFKHGKKYYMCGSYPEYNKRGLLKEDYFRFVGN